MLLTIMIVSFHLTSKCGSQAPRHPYDTPRRCLGQSDIQNNINIIICFIHSHYLIRIPWNFPKATSHDRATY